MSSRVALITGGASGIGKSIACKLSGQGYIVVLVDRNKDLLKETSSEIRSNGGEAHAILMDVTDGLAIHNLFQAWGEELKVLDVLVNSAAITKKGALVETNSEDWDSILEVNLKAAYLFCKYAHPYLRKSKGSVLHISSVMGHYLYPGNTVYSISKSGINHMTKLLAKEWLHDNIRVNALLPASVDTPLLRAGYKNEAEAEKQISEGLASGRIQTVDQVADAACLLLRPEAAILTGQCIVADAGSQL